MKFYKIFSAALILALLLSALPVLSVSAIAAAPPVPSSPDFGPNVMIFDPSMPTSQIQAAVDAIANQQIDNEMGMQRYALLFKPGVYGKCRYPAHFPSGLLH